MIDALLLSVRDAVRNGGFGYDYKTCDVMADGHPPPRCGDWFLAIHQLAVRSVMDNALDERYGFALTLTRRVTVPLDRVGGYVMVSEIARQQANETGFNARCDQLRAFLHMNWAIIGDANNFMIQTLTNANLVYGFSEPARYRSMEIPKLVGGEWFSADPEAGEVGIKSELQFQDCRRGPQAIASYT